MTTTHERETRPATAMQLDRGAHVLLLGDGQLATATRQALDVGGAVVTHLTSPSDADIRASLHGETGGEIDRAVVLSRHDHVALRRALVLHQLRPDLPLLVTIYDRNVAATLQRTVPNVRVTSAGDLVAPTLAAACLDQDLCSLRTEDDGTTVAVAPSADGPRQVPATWSTPSRVARLAANLESIARPFDTSARILVYGLLGFLAVLVAETVVTMTATNRSFLDALYLAAKVTVTVGPNTAIEEAAAWAKVFSVVAMISTVGIAALLTAGLVNRLTDARLTGITGRAAVPRRGHVIVVGLGQVGYRLCGLLRDLGVPVVALEQNPNAKNVIRARDDGLPVVIGSGASRRTLRRVSIRSARALAAVTSDEIENIAVSVAARGLRANMGIALRAGDGDATSEVGSLFGIGTIRDVYRLAGTALATTALGQPVTQAFPCGDDTFLVHHGTDAIVSFSAGCPDRP